MQPVIVDGRLVMAFDALPAAGVMVVCAVMLGAGLIAQRYLRTMGDMPQMAALRWGARWFGPVVVAALLVYGLGMYLGVTRTSYPLTALAIGRFGIIVVVLLPLLLLPTQAHGWLLGLVVLVDAVRFTSRDYRAWVQRRVGSGGRGTYEWLILLVLLVGPMVAAAGVARNAYQADRQSLQVRQATAAQQAIRSALADLPVEAVSVAPVAPQRMRVRVLGYQDLPDEALRAIHDRVQQMLPRLPEADSHWDLTVLTHDVRLEKALGEALAEQDVQDIAVTRAWGAEPSAVTITLDGPADERRSKALGTRAERALRQLGVGEGWQVRVQPGGGPQGRDEIQLDLSSDPFAAF